MAIEFWVSLRGATYDENTGWACSALSVPASQVTQLRVDGKNIATEDFKVESTHIRLLNPSLPVPDSAAKIAVQKRLIKVDTAVVVAVLGLSGSLAGSYVSYTVGMQERASVAVPRASSSAKMSDNSPIPTEPRCQASIERPSPSERVHDEVVVNADIAERPRDEYAHYFVVERIDGSDGPSYWYKGRLALEADKLRGRISHLGKYTQETVNLVIMAVTEEAATQIDEIRKAGKETADWDPLTAALKGRSMNCGEVTVRRDEDTGKPTQKKGI